MRLLLAEHKAPVRRLRKLIVNDATQDVAQKVWIEIQTVRDSPPIHNQHAYLHRLAHSVAVDHGQNDQRQASVSERAQALL